MSSGAKVVSAVLCLTAVLADFSFSDAKAGNGNTVSAQARIEKMIIRSESLKKDMNVLVYLPKGYSCGKKYPVLYFIHGFNKDETLLIEAGFDRKASALIESGRIDPLIIVFPQMDNSWGINSSAECRIADHDSETFHFGMYEDYFFKEVIPAVDSKFSTDKNRGGRYIGGSSMGGYISLSYGFRRSDLFSKIGGHMPSVIIHPRFSWFVFSSKELRMKRDLNNMVSSENLSGLDIFLDCGGGDSLFPYVSEFNQLLLKKGVKTRFSPGEGAHNTAYIASRAGEYLLFYAGK